MRAVTAILFLTLVTRARSADWPPAYAEVRAFYYGTATESMIEPDGKPHFTLYNQKGVLLTQQQISSLLSGALDTKHSPRAFLNCYYPRHGFVFYDERHQIVAVFEVCFDCLHVRFFPPRDQSFCDFLAVALLCDELKLPLHPDGTTSAEFGARLERYRERWKQRHPEVQ